jgi:hypothetical protein
MKTFLLRTSLVMLLTMILTSAFAKVWRVNKTPGIIADFVELSAAAASAAVQNGDTIHLEGAPVNYNNFTLYKKLVIIGPGYFLDATGNPGLQANTNSAKATVMLDSLSTGSQFMGLEGTIYLDSKVDDISITRCNVGVYGSTAYPNSTILGVRISQSYLSISLNTTHRLENFQITNCIVYNAMSIANTYNGLVRNNVFSNVNVTISNSYVANNIIYNAAVTLVSCTVRNNIATTNVLPVGNGNQNSIPAASLFVGTGSTDGAYMLKTGSPAIGAGETVNGITPDCGAFGTADPYRLSGIPPIPSIYLLTVPAAVATSATTMPITISTRSNN